MRKVKTFLAVLMLVFVLGLATPQALAGDTLTPPGLTGETQTPPGQLDSPPGTTQGPPGFADWANIIIQILGNGWNI